MNDVVAILTNVVYALNTIDVKGKYNLGTLYGGITAIEGVIEQLSEEDDKE